MCCSVVTLAEYDRLALAMFGVKPEPSGIVRWCGVRWIGVPFPLRLAAIARAMIHAREWLPVRKAMRKFAGCGCIERLKRLFT